MYVCACVRAFVCVSTYVHVYVTLIHIRNTHTYSRASSHADTHKQMHTRTHARTHAHALIHAHACTHARTQASTHTHSHKQTHKTLTSARTHARTHARSCYPRIHCIIWNYNLFVYISEIALRALAYENDSN